MKLQSHRPLRGVNIETIFTRSNPKSRRGMNPFTSKLEEITKVPSYKPSGVTQRIANVRRKKGGFKAVGITDVIPGNFEEAKKALRNLGFTGIKMGAVKVVL